MSIDFKSEHATADCGAKLELATVSLSCPLCTAPAEKAKLCCPCCKRELDPTWEPGLAVLSVKRAYCRACKTDFPAYLLGVEERTLIASVKRALKDQDEGSSSNCWPLVSFGGQNADLDAKGCTGIKKIYGAIDDKLIFEIGGHKTFVASDCLGTEDEAKRGAFDDIMRELVCNSGYDAEWTGDDWTVSFSGMISLCILYKDQTQGSIDGLAPSSEPDFEATASAVIAEAKARCAEFESAMAKLDTRANELYEEFCKETGNE